VNTYVRVAQLKRFVKNVEGMREQDLSSKEIARRLGVPISTMNLRVRQFKAFEKRAQGS
jgi:NADH/NAD ratio-sensing transcriptional regulator Rex